MFVRHISSGVDVDQHADAGYKEQPDGRQGIKEEAGIHVKWSWSAIALRKIKMAVAGAKPGIENSLKRPSRTVCEVTIFVHGEASGDERQNDDANADGADG